MRTLRIYPLKNDIENKYTKSHYILTRAHTAQINEVEFFSSSSSTYAFYLSLCLITVSQNALLS